MEKWALKLGLKFEHTESDKALHWLTSAVGGDPALTGLTRLEGGGDPSDRSGAAFEPWAGMLKIKCKGEKPGPWHNRVKELRSNRG